MRDLELTNEDLRAIARKRYYRERRWLGITLVGVFLLSLCILVAGTLSHKTADREYVSISGHTVIISEDGHTLDNEPLYKATNSSRNKIQPFVGIMFGSGFTLLILALIGMLCLDNRETKATEEFVDWAKEES